MQSLLQLGDLAVGSQLPALIDDQGVGLLQLAVEGVELTLERGVVALLGSEALTSASLRFFDAASRRAETSADHFALVSSSSRL